MATYVLETDTHTESGIAVPALSFNKSALAFTHIHTTCYPGKTKKQFEARSDETRRGCTRSIDQTNSTKESVKRTIGGTCSIRPIQSDPKPRPTTLVRVLLPTPWTLVTAHHRGRLATRYYSTSRSPTFLQEFTMRPYQAIYGLACGVLESRSLHHHFRANKPSSSPAAATKTKNAPTSPPQDAQTAVSKPASNPPRKPATYTRNAPAKPSALPSKSSSMTRPTKRKTHGFLPRGPSSGRSYRLHLRISIPV